MTFEEARARSRGPPKFVVSRVVDFLIHQVS